MSAEAHPPRRSLAAAAWAAWLGASVCPAAQAPARLGGTDLVAVAAETSGLTHQLDLHTKAKPTGLNWPWLSPPASAAAMERSSLNTAP